MNYSVETQIQVDRHTLVELYINPANYSLWMRGLKEHKRIKGKASEEGAKSEFVFDMNGKEMKMTETVISNNLPDEYRVTYEAKNVYNLVNTHFEEVDENTTKCITTTHFKFQGFMKVIAWLFPSSFKKQSEQYLNDFKNFAEQKAKVQIKQSA